MPIPSSITTFHSDGFTPSKLQLDLGARLSGRTLVLHPGTAATVGAATHMRMVNVVGAWSTRFRFTAAGGSFAFHLQNSTGYSNSFADGNVTADKLGTAIDGYHSLVFRVDSGASTYGLKQGRYTGLAHVSPTYVPDAGGPASGPNFTLGHDFTVNLAWTPPAIAASNGTARLILTDLTTAEVWAGTYTGLSAIPPYYRLLQDEPDGTRVHVGFTAMTGTTARPPVVLKSWEWSDPDGTPPAVHATGQLVVSTPGNYSAGAYVAGKLKALLLPLTPMDAGEYLVRSDGLDELGNALPSSYEIKAIRSPAVGTSKLIGQKPGLADPVKNWTLTGALANMGVIASPNGSTCFAMTNDQESVGQAGRFLMNGATGEVIDDLQYDLRFYTGHGQDWVYLSEAVGLYLFTDDFASAFYACPRIIDYHTQGNGFTGTVGTVNPDGSTLSVLSLTSMTTCLRWSYGPLGYHLVPRIAAAVGGATFVAAVKIGHYVGEYNCTTGYQVGNSIAVPNPMAVAIMPDGKIAVAHSAVLLDGNGNQVLHDWPTFNGPRCPATRLSFFEPTTHVQIGATVDLANAEDIFQLSCRNGRLSIADNGPTQKNLKIYSVAGHTIGALIRTVGRPATFADDNGRDTFWNLNGGSIDDAGNAYIGTRPFGTASRNQGSVSVSFDTAGLFRWTNFALGFTNAAVAAPDNEPDVVLTSMLKAMRKRVDGDYDYIGAMAYPNPGQNGTAPLMGIEFGQCNAPMTTANLGGVDFVAIPSYGRLPIFRHLGGNRIKPAASVGFRYIATVRETFTWTNPGNNDSPAFADASLFGPTHPNTVGIGAAYRLQLAPNGDAWFSDELTSQVWRIPLAGLNGVGNPVYDWSAKQLKASPSAATYQPIKTIYLAVASDAFYLLVDDPRYSPYTSATYNGYTQGGCKGLIAFALDGTHLWSVPMPEFCVSIAAFTGGVAVGGHNTSRIHVYRKSDGLPTIMIRPITVTDSLDFTGGALTAKRLATGKVLIGAEAIRASGYLLSDYDDSAPAPAYSATMTAGQTVPLVGGTMTMTFRLRGGVTL